MRAESPRGLTFAAVQLRALRVPRIEALPTIPLAGIVALAAGLRFANLSALGYVNHYYSAATVAMLQSWHNFFFVAAEPGGSVSIDKPPVGLWLQAISAYIFGVNSLGVLLPQILAGILSVIVVYFLVRRWFGTAAGLIAALALAITPVAIATDRNNTIDSTLILTLLLAAWAFIKATESAKLRYLLLGAVLVGIGFNIKMLEAFLPLPAFYLLYFFGTKERIWRKIPKMGLATVVLLVVSLSWAIVVDATPADQRPYIGSSGTNSEINLALGYNGTERLLGMGGRGGLLSGLFGGQSGGNGAFSPGNGAFPQPGNNGGFQQPGTNGGIPPQNPNGSFRQRDGNGNFGRGNGNGFNPGGAAAGISNTGQAGPLRLFTTPLSKEASWLLPLALVGLGILAFTTRLAWPVARKHQAMLLWGGWLAAAGVFFSVAGFFHEYYLSTLAPPLAALVGIGAVALWRFRGKHNWLGTGLLVVVAGGTLAFQIYNARPFVGYVWWLGLGLAVALVGVAVLVVASFWRRNVIARVGFAVIVLALMVTPGIWSGFTTAYSSVNQSLPAAYDGQTSNPPNEGSIQVNQSLLDYLQAHTQGMKYLMAVPSSMQGADYVLATGRPVLYLGGFMGQDNVLTVDQLAKLVADGELRYIYWGGSGRMGFGSGQSDISSWVESHGVAIQGFNTETRNSGAPDGTSGGPNGTDGRAQGFGNMQVTLYDLAPDKP
jgi:4-amino-4-deoxy-L-arabinose transferase-like glycosyltransferase